MVLLVLQQYRRLSHQQAITAVTLSHPYGNSPSHVISRRSDLRSIFFIPIFLRVPKFSTRMNIRCLNHFNKRQINTDLTIPSTSRYLNFQQVMSPESPGNQELSWKFGLSGSIGIVGGQIQTPRRKPVHRTNSSMAERPAQRVGVLGLNPSLTICNLQYRTLASQKKLGTSL